MKRAFQLSKPPASLPHGAARAEPAMERTANMAAASCGARYSGFMQYSLKDGFKSAASLPVIGVAVTFADKRLKKGKTAALEREKYIFGFSRDAKVPEEIRYEGVRVEGCCCCSCAGFVHLPCSRAGHRHGDDRSQHPFWSGTTISGGRADREFAGDDHSGLSRRQQMVPG